MGENSYRQELTWEGIAESVRYTNIELFHVLKTQTLKELKQQVVAQASDLLSHQYEQYPLVRQLLAECSDIDRLRVWYGNRLLQSDAATLKKHGVSSGSVLTFEILPAPQKTGPNDTLLYLFGCGKTDETSEATEIEPLGEYVLKHDSPSVDDLRNAISRDVLSKDPSAGRFFGRGPADFAVAKYSFHKIAWDIIKPTVISSSVVDTADTASGSGRKKVNHKKLQKEAQNAANLRKNEYRLSSGDVVFLLPPSLFDQQTIQDLLFDSRIFKKVLRPTFGQDDSIIKTFGPHFSGHAGPRVEESVEIDIGLID